VGAVVSVGGRALGAADCVGSAVPDAQPVTIIARIVRATSTFRFLMCLASHSTLYRLSRRSKDNRADVSGFIQTSLDIIFHDPFEDLQG
jgi:hypothetical protein